MSMIPAAIALGFLGSFHCIGMCGPIALALPVHQYPALKKHFLIALYNLGRIFTYMFFGAISGLIGQGLIFAGYQQALSITIGILLLFAIFFPFKKDLSGNSIFVKIRSNLNRMFEKGTRSSLFFIGLLNGFLPCGLVYTGIAGAAASGDISGGAVFMIAFGLGTVPMMFTLPLIGNRVSASFRTRIRKAGPVLVVLMALLFILRGLNLGIPYLSPKTEKDTQTMSCHENYPDKSKMVKCEKPAMFCKPEETP